jgi:hypothetical protein
LAAKPLWEASCSLLWATDACGLFKSQDSNRDYFDDKSNDVNLTTKAITPIKSNPLNMMKRGNPMGQT